MLFDASELEDGDSGMIKGKRVHVVVSTYKINMSRNKISSHNSLIHVRLPLKNAIL